MAQVNDSQLANARTLELREISKRFGKATVLEDVSLNVQPGEVLGLLGENGAGKSTLMKIVMGVHSADSGEIWVGGERRGHSSPDIARSEGLAMVYQELSLVPQLTVAQNVMLGAERLGLLNMTSDRAAEERCRQLCKEFNVDLDPRSRAESLSFGQRQMVEILKALNRRAQTLILDEPTASLTAREQDLLFSTMRELVDRGCSIIFISHRLREVLEVTDRVQVLRNGCTAGTTDTSDADIASLVAMMVGSAEVAQRERGGTRAAPSSGSTATLRVKNLATKTKLRDCTLHVSEREVVGLTGLVGAGRSSLLRCLFGLQRVTAGEVELAGRAYQPKSPRTAVQRGVALVPEDRASQGIFGGLSVQQNLTSTCWERVAAWPALGGLSPVRRRMARGIARTQFDALQVKAQGLGQPLGELSGGTQQKVVLGKWIIEAPALLMCDEPTAGVDVGTKDEIWRMMHELADRGTAVLYSSSDLEELAMVCDRVLIMAEGTIVTEVVDGVTDDEYLRTVLQSASAEARAGSAQPDAEAKA
jgi:ribose transport system ATP-binding protein